MNTPEWTKPALLGAAAGAAALAIVGFSWGGWATAGTAQKMAQSEARLQVVSALVPICLEQSRNDPQASQKMKQIKDASSYQRSNLLMEAGWATMPGSDDPNRNVASACVDQLEKQF